MSKSPEKTMIGGKAKGLLFLKKNGFLIPPFFTLPHDVLLNTKSLKAELSQILKNNSKINCWAVRSSASTEDGSKKSYAGQFKTVLNVKSEELTEAIYAVVDSYSSVQDDKHGVILQEMIEPEISGVLFSRDPLDLISCDTVLSAVPGIGSRLVNGELDGCTLRLSDKSILSVEEGTFEGFRFENNQEATVHLSHQEIRQMISKHLSEIINGISKLENLQNRPIDIEFAIAQGKFYWLQQRPITSRNFVSPSKIWDKTASEISFPGYTLPLSCSLNNRGIGLACKKVDIQIGYSKKILAQNERFTNDMSREINGALYYNLTAWQSLIYQLPFGKKYSKQLPVTWGMSDMPFPKPKKRHNWFLRVKIGIKMFLMLLNYKKYQKNYNKSFKDLLDLTEQAELTKMSSQELFAFYERIEAEITEHYFAALSNGYFALVAFSRLKERLKKTKILESHPNFANDILMNQKDFISVAAVDELRSLLDVIVDNKKLHELFQNKKASEIIQELGLNHNQFLAFIKTYISEHGHRSPNGDLKIENVTFHDDILVFIDYLKGNSVHYKKRIKRVEAFNYEETLNTFLASKPLKKRKIQKLISKVISRTRDRELYRYQRSQAFSISRKIFTQMGRTLASEGWLENAKDVAYLSCEDIACLNNESNYKSLVQQKKAQYESYYKQELPPTYVEAKGEMHAVFQQASSVEDGEIKGVGCCSGVVSGDIMLIESDTDLQKDLSDSILIGLYFEPGQMSLLSNAKGIISERGNLLSHTAIMCREMGIPSIVGAKGITKNVANHTRVKMNGGTGIIQLETDESL